METKSLSVRADAPTSISHHYFPQQLLLAVRHLQYRYGPRGRGIRKQPVKAARRAARASPHAQLATPRHLQQLESESIHVLREVAAEAVNPVMLYSVGKDSSVMLHLARKAFYPGVPPFPLLHVDTTWKFREMYAFRDRVAAASGMQLIGISR